MEVEKRLARLGIILPAPGEALGDYRPAVVWGGLLYTSGQLPMSEGKLVCSGKVGDGVGAQVSAEEAGAAARLCAVNALAQARAVLGDLDKIRQVVKVVGYVQSAPGFGGQPGVLNGASRLLAQVFGEAGCGVRSAVGVAELPLNAPVEIEFVFAVDPGEAS